MAVTGGAVAGLWIFAVAGDEFPWWAPLLAAGFGGMLAPLSTRSFRRQLEHIRAGAMTWEQIEKKNLTALNLVCSLFMALITTLYAVWAGMDAAANDPRRWIEARGMTVVAGLLWWVVLRGVRQRLRRPAGR